MNFSISLRNISFVFLFVMAASLGYGQAVPDVVPQAQAAHGHAKYHKKKAIAFDLLLKFGGAERFRGRITVLPGSGKIRMEYQDGKVVIWDGKSVWRAPADKPNKSARFAVFTWEYFFQLPFKLTDPGTQWENKETRNWNGVAYPTAKLSFQPGTGDAHTDWYQLYFDPKTKLVTAAAYIVTYSRSVEKAEESIHAISYANFETQKGVTYATEWKFWDWTFEEGFGKELGEAKVSNLSLKRPAADLWEVPAGAVEVKYNPGK